MKAFYVEISDAELPVSKEKGVMCYVSGLPVVFIKNTTVDNLQVRKLMKRLTDLVDVKLDPHFFAPRINKKDMKKFFDNLSKKEGK